MWPFEACTPTHTEKELRWGQQKRESGCGGSHSHTYTQWCTLITDTRILLWKLIKMMPHLNTHTQNKNTMNCCMAEEEKKGRKKERKKHKIVLVSLSNPDSVIALWEHGNVFMGYRKKERRRQQQKRPSKEIITEQQAHQCLLSPPPPICCSWWCTCTSRVNNNYRAEKTQTQ